jgi:hypothetical protein
MHRRDFVKGAAAVAGVLAVRSAGARAAAHGITAVVYDERYGDARCFAGVLVRHGAVPFATRRNIARLWYDAAPCDTLVSRSRIAGFTPYSDFMLAQAIVGRRGAAVLYEGVHDCRGSNTLNHGLKCGVSAQQLGEVLATAGAGWPSSLAVGLESYLTDESPGRILRIATATRRAPDFPGTLVSWVMAAK